MSHPINGLMDSSMQNLRQLIDVNTIIGDAITTPDGTMIIPVSKVSFGFASGGSEFPTNKQPTTPFGGGNGGGVTIQPIAFLVIKPGGGVQLLQLSTSHNTADKVVNMVPEVIDKISGIFAKNTDEVSTDNITSEAVK